MRHNFIYSVLHLSTLTFFTAATPPGRCNKVPQSKICLPFDLNMSAAEVIPPEISFPSSNEQIASSPATDNLINPSRYTPEELAANNLVFTGPRGPNLSAGVQSALSHSRDHREYPLGQQSFSPRFSSNSPGKRKTSDSSAGSTSKRYKKVDTSDRCERYNVINQHFSLKNSVSDVIPSSSEPEYVLPREKNPTRDAIGKYKEKELAVCTGLETNKKEPALFNVYDWNFLREYPEREKPDDHPHQFLRYLNHCKGENDVESFFFIQRDRARQFLNQYVSKKLHHWEFNLPMHSGKRDEMLFKTSLRLSDKKINLERYPFFQGEIIDSMWRRLKKNIKATQNQSGPRIVTIMKFVRDVTKVTQLLIVAQLSLFKEHEPKGVTVQEVEKHLRFLQELWFQIEEGTPEMQKHDWAMRAHQVFKFQAHERPIYVLALRKDKMYSLSWNVVNYWRDRTGKSLRGCDGSQIFPNTLQEVVNKIIFFSNYPDKLSSFPKKIPRNSRKGREDLSARGKIVPQQYD